MEHYTTKMSLNTTPTNVFNALTNAIPLWWTELFEGSAARPGDRFTIRFGEHIFKTMQVEELSVGTKVVWQVTDSLIALPGLHNQKEWVGTTIIWEIVSAEHHTELILTHKGLSPEVECYNICTEGWSQFLGSLKQYVETGKGNPYKE